MVGHKIRKEDRHCIEMQVQPEHGAQNSISSQGGCEEWEQNEIIHATCSEQCIPHSKFLNIVRNFVNIVNLRRKKNHKSNGKGKAQ